jgi:hypothetical protein
MQLPIIFLGTLLRGALTDKTLSELFAFRIFYRNFIQDIPHLAEFYCIAPGVSNFIFQPAIMLLCNNESLKSPNPKNY